MKVYDSEFQMRTIIQNEVMQYVKDGGVIKELAENAGVSPSTISKLAHMETKYPRMTTIIGAMNALGYVITWQKANVVQLPTLGTDHASKFGKHQRPVIQRPTRHRRAR